jgi:hypothetical protein
MFQFGTEGINMATKKDPLRKTLSQCVGKICAYMAVGKVIEARQWADTLVKELRKTELIK